MDWSHLRRNCLLKHGIKG